MKRDEKIDLATLDTELVEAFARELEPQAAPCESGARVRWTDGFRASGAKHAQM
jgi:hypothetical protein